MPSTRQKIYEITSTQLKNREFSRRELLTLIDQHYPGTNHGSILPSDYLVRDAVKGDPSNDGNRGNYMLYPRFLERVSRDRYKFVGWDGRDPGSLTAPSLRMGTSELKTEVPIFHTYPPPRFSPAQPLAAGSDHERLVAALRQLAPSIRPSQDRAWRREPAVRVIDCVLSLNRAYDSFVVPRLDRFERAHPDVRSVSELQELISKYASPDAFVSQVLNYRHAERAETLTGVVKWLATVAGQDSCAEQLSNVERWAANARPNDYLALRIKGFGLAGFQYMRMLFGANTTKPDIHICRYVSNCIGRTLSDIEALQLLERAALEAGVLLRDLDTTIWEHSARRCS
jgi:hypothetical protein